MAYRNEKNQQSRKEGFKVSEIYNIIDWRDRWVIMGVGFQ